MLCVTCCVTHITSEEFRFEFDEYECNHPTPHTSFMTNSKQKQIFNRPGVAGAVL